MANPVATHTDRRPTRREFLAGVGVVFGWLGLLKLFARPVESYVPAGHLVVGDGRSRDVETVTLDGEVVTHCYELNDVEGWLRRDVIDGSERVYPRRVRTEHLTGVVRVQWRAARQRDGSRG